MDIAVHIYGEGRGLGRKRGGLPIVIQEGLLHYATDSFPSLFLKMIRPLVRS